MLCTSLSPPLNGLKGERNLLPSVKGQPPPYGALRLIFRGANLLYHMMGILSIFDGWGGVKWFWIVCDHPFKIFAFRKKKAETKAGI